MYLIRKVFNWLLVMIIAVTLAMFTSWLIIAVEASSIISDRMKEICLVVAEENCLPGGDVISYDTLGGGHGSVNYELNLRQIYTDVLNDTVQQSSSFAKHFIHFGDQAIIVHDAKKSCDNINLSDQYYSADTAPQRGKQLCVEVHADVRLPVYFYMNAGDVKPPTEWQHLKSYERTVGIDIHRSLKIYGTKYYQDKDYDDWEKNPFN